MDFSTVVRHRRMVRNYSSEPIEMERLDRILDVATRGPSAGFSQGQSFVAITDPAIKLQVAEIAGEPAYVKQGFDPWVSRAAALIVCCTSESAYRARYAEPDKLGPDGSQIEWPIPYWFVDAGCALMGLLLSAVNEGLAAGFLGFDAGGYKELKKLLLIPDDVTPIGMVTIGSPLPDRKSGSLKRGWKARNQVVHMQKWGSD